MLLIKIPKIKEDNVQLFIGDYEACNNKEALRENKITHIINCAYGIPCYYKDSFEYIELNLFDDTDDLLARKFNVLAMVERCKKIKW